jgi:3D-(3,5/4)-trihydroxycyclohexane-1,2-dione acylhydrolase (decyclizing)
MGYEIPGGLGVKMAEPDREVYVMIGDGSYLMMPGELVTALQEGLKLVVVLVDNHGFSSIGALSRSVGSDGFGTHYRYRSDGSLGTDSQPSGEVLPSDVGGNAESLGARLIRARTVAALRQALREARTSERTVVIHVEVDRYEPVPSYESWWDVPVAETSRREPVAAARREYEEGRRSERPQLEPAS